MYINLILNKEEENYVNASLEDTAQDIYRVSNFSNIGSTIYCNLPKGSYNFVFRTPKDANNAYASFRLKGLDAFCNDNRVLLTINQNTKLSFPVLSGGTKHLINLLRLQVVHNNRLYGGERLIEKVIKSRSTDLGEIYNRQSFEDNIMDYFNDNEDLNVDLTKSIKDTDVKYLQLMKYMQDKNRYDIKKQQLDMEEMELELREQTLLKY